MQVIDKRGKPLDTCFDELSLGDVFQGTNDRIYIKASSEHALGHADNGTWVYVPYDNDELVIPLKATLTVERRDG